MLCQGVPMVHLHVSVSTRAVCTGVKPAGSTLTAQARPLSSQGSSTWKTHKHMYIDLSGVFSNGRYFRREAGKEKEYIHHTIIVLLSQRTLHRFFFSMSTKYWCFSRHACVHLSQREKHTWLSPRGSSCWWRWCAPAGGSRALPRSLAVSSTRRWSQTDGEPYCHEATPFDGREVGVNYKRG